jgi:transcription elongation factor GreA
MDHANYVSEEGLEEVKKELEELKTKKRQEVADHLKRAKEYGDLSENSEYVEAREEQSQVEKRIFELDEFVKNAVVIQKTTGAKKVQVGSNVTVKKGGKSFVYTIVGSNESDPVGGKISNESPMGKAFLNHEVGEEVKVHTPAGVVSYEILKIQ